jgi:hypothetical protein
MPCILALLAFFFPRLVIILLAIFGNYMDAAYKTLIWPLLGFLFLPYTTLAYAWAINSSPNHSLQGLGLIVFVIAILVDIGVIGGGAKAKKR